ncbi:MAG TPA: DUF3892 domain-containing protein [Parvibaculum sp.]|jgi:hypothetical protein
MVDRTVKRSGKDKDGDITSLCGDESWSPRSKADVIKDIEGNHHRYLVKGRTEVIVVDGIHGKYLRTKPNNADNDNLDNLPDC